MNNPAFFLTLMVLGTVPGGDNALDCLAFNSHHSMAEALSEKSLHKLDQYSIKDGDKTIFWLIGQMANINASDIKFLSIDEQLPKHYFEM